MHTVSTQLPNPLWTVYWYVDHHDDVVREFKRIGFKIRRHGGSAAYDVEDKPTVYRQVAVRERESRLRLISLPGSFRYLFQVLHGALAFLFADLVHDFLEFWVCR